ncbi:MAG TPA: sirohydrochlorin chelatase [Mycobacterium sp.]|jgi:sirohydrochlorin ferrochelatase
MMILVAHGTRSSAGVQTVETLRAAVAARIGTVRTAYVDVLGPNPTHVLRQVPGPAVVVPAFLSSGYHVRADLPARIAESRHRDVILTPALGPDPVLAAVMRDRLGEAGWRHGDAVVMAAAGSTDPRARRELHWAAALLARHVGDVAVGFTATGPPSVREVVRMLRVGGRRRVFIAPYLLAPGLFHERLHDCGAAAVAAPIGAHPAVVELLISRRFSPRPTFGSESACNGRQNVGADLEGVAEVA